MSRAMFRKRLDALNAAIRPAHSIAANVAGLNDEQRHQWERYKIREAEWNKRHTTPAQAYEAMANGDYPRLRADIDEAIYGRRPIITADTTVQQAAEFYEKVK